MNDRTYPRYYTTKITRWRGQRCLDCGDKATMRLTIETNEMRGDDFSGVFCSGCGQKRIEYDGGARHE